MLLSRVTLRRLSAGVRPLVRPAAASSSLPHLQARDNRLLAPAKTMPSSDLRGGCGSPQRRWLVRENFPFSKIPSQLSLPSSLHGLPGARAAELSGRPRALLLRRGLASSGVLPSSSSSPREQIPTALEVVAKEINAIEQDIAATTAAFWAVGKEVDGASKKAEEHERDPVLGPYWRDKVKQLRDEKIKLLDNLKQLRDKEMKEMQLRTELLKATSSSSTPQLPANVISGEEPMAARHLSCFSWKFNPPLNLRQYSDKTPGESVPYVKPIIFDTAYKELTDFYVDESNIVRPANIKRSRIVFIEGASGCGKTRLGWELFQQLSQNRSDRVGYVAVTGYGDESILFENKRDHISGGKLLKRRLMAAATGPLNVSVKKLNCDRLDLATLCEAIVPEPKDGGRRALVVHFDEFQDGPVEVAAMLRAIRNCNSEQNNTVAILPVLTGLINSPTEERVRMGLTAIDVQPVPLRLNYFGTSQEGREASWQLVKNTDATFRSPALTQYRSLEDAPAMLRYLVEDTFGWPVALVFLAATVHDYKNIIAELSAEQSSIQTPARQALVRQSIWQLVEGLYIARVKAIYSAEAFKEALGEINVVKLLLLALSPHAVHQDEPINGVQVKHLQQYGLVDVTKASDDKQFCRLRLSKPLLSILNCEHKICNEALLQSCHDYDDKVQEQVQVVSLAVSLAAWSTIRVSQQPLTLETLRPGILLYGDSSDKALTMQLPAPPLSTSTPSWLTVRYSEFVDPNKPKKKSKKVQSQEPHETSGSGNMSKVRTLYLGKEQKAVQRGTFSPQFGLMKSRTAEGNDGYALLKPAVVHMMQSKGQQTGYVKGRPGDDHTMGPVEVEKVFSGMANSVPEAIVVTNERKRKAESTPVNTPSLELMTPKRVPAANDGTKQKLDEDVARKTCLLLHRENLETALGFVFAGVVVRAEADKRAEAEKQEAEKAKAGGKKQGKKK